ncbi:MAG: gliding motility lipoprotein GldH [Cyclobacteriaceae bacterium]|nr:gliding motility lipoprotein GldH [Cyclobacteriaceae bacterium]
MKYIFFLLLASLFIAGCHSNRVYEDYKEFDTKAWLVNDPAVFEFEISDTTKKYNLYYNVRNTLQYPFARIFVNYTLTDSTGIQLSKQLLSNYLFDQKTGQPLGRSGLGDVYDNQFLILENQYFRKSGAYTLQLEQFNRLDTLAGILAVGFRIETVQ